MFKEIKSVLLCIFVSYLKCMYLSWYWMQLEQCANCQLPRLSLFGKPYKSHSQKISSILLNCLLTKRKYTTPTSDAEVSHSYLNFLNPSTKTYAAAVRNNELSINIGQVLGTRINLHTELVTN